MEKFFYLGFFLLVWSIFLMFSYKLVVLLFLEVIFMCLIYFYFIFFSAVGFFYFFSFVFLVFMVLDSVYGICLLISSTRHSSSSSKFYLSL